MYKSLLVLGAFLTASFGAVLAQQSATQEKPKESQASTEESKIPQEAIDRKNPVKPTPESLAEARRFFGYDCAMCHGAQGDGKGDLADSMKLKMNDWRDSTVLAGKTDGELFYLITKGRGKMIGENDRVSETIRWNLVNYVRSLAKKNGAEKPASEAPKP